MPNRNRVSIVAPRRSANGGLRVTKLGTSSVTYEVTIAEDGAESPAATASLTHVFVDRATRRPTPLPDRIRAALAELVAA